MSKIKCLPLSSVSLVAAVHDDRQTNPLLYLCACARGNNVRNSGSGSDWTVECSIGHRVRGQHARAAAALLDINDSGNGRQKT